MAGRGVYGQRGKNPQRKIATRKRWAQVVDLVAQNMTYEQVAQALGYKSVAGVHKALHTLLKENAAAAAEKYRHVEDQRIEALLSVYMPAAMGGDLDAAKFVDALIGRRSRLIGANAPERAPVNEKGETVGEDPFTTLTRRLDRLAAVGAAPGGAGGPDAGAGGENQP